MKEIIDRSRQTFNKLFDHIGKFGSKYDTYNFTAFDTETNALLKGDARLGAQTDIFKQGATGIRTIFTRNVAYDAFGNIKEDSASHLLIGGKKISAAGQKFFKDVGLTIDKILPNFSDIPPEYRQRLAGRALSNSSLKYLELIQKKTGKKFFTSEGELAGVLNKMLGYSPNTLNVAIGHNASRFDLMMARGVKGFAGVGISSHIIDTYELTTRLFPELAVEKTGALELDNLISLMMYDSSNRTKTLIKDPLRKAAPTSIDALKFYGLSSVPPEFVAVSKMFGGTSGVLAAGAHSADVDSLRSMALLHAAMLRADASPNSAEIFHKYLAEVGIKDNLSAVDIMSRIKKFDPQQVSRYMNVGGYKGKIKDLFDILQSGQTTVDNLTVYSRSGMNQLFSELTNRFGKQFTESFAPVAKSLSESMDAGVFMLQGSSLKFGKLGDAASFIGLPTQNFNKLGSGLINVGDKLRSVTNLLSLANNKAKVVPFSRFYYSTMNKLIHSGMNPTDSNAAYALPNIVKQTLKEKVFEGRSLGSLLGTHPTEMGLPNFSAVAAKSGVLQVIDGNAPIIQHFKNLRSGIQQRNLSIGNNLSNFKRARKLIETSIAGLSSELNRLGIGAQAAFSKAESFLEDGLKLNVGSLLTEMTIPEVRGFEKGRLRRLGTIADSHTARLKKFGRPVGPSIVTNRWQESGIRSSFQGGVLVAEFDSMQNLRSSFEDSAAYASRTGLNLLRQKRYAGSVTLKDWSSRDIDLLSQYLDPTGGFNLDPGADFRPTDPADYFKVRNRRMFADKRREIARELFRNKSKVQKRALEQIVRSRAALSQAIFTEDAIQLKFATRRFTTSRSDSLLFGPLGSLRTTINGYVGGRMSKLMKAIGADYVMSAENLKGMAPADLITQHRISVIQREGALDELVGFFNSQRDGFRLAPSNVPGVRTLVMPTGVTKDEVLKFTQLFRHHLVKTAAENLDKDRTRRTLKILRNYDGIRISGNIIKKIASIGMKGITSASRLFLTDIHLRSDAADVNRLNNVKWNASHISQYKQSLAGAGLQGNSVSRFLERKMYEATGFSLSRGVLNPGRLGFIGQALSGNLPTGAHVLKLGANKQLIDQHGASYGFLPKVGSGHLLTPESLKGTIYDPAFSDRQFFIDFGQAERFTVRGRKEGQISTRYLPVPNLRQVLGVKVTSGGARVSSSSLAGRVFRAIRAYTSEGNLDAMHTLKTGGRYSIRDTVSSAISDLLNKIPGKKGLAKALTTFSIKESVNARLLGKAATGDLTEAFTAELDSAQFAEWARIKFGQEKADKFLAIAKNDALYGLVRADPMQKGGHAAIVKYKLINRGGSPSAKMDVFLDPYLVSRLNRDVDKDAVRLLLFDQISADDLGRDFQDQVVAHAADFNTYLKNLANTKAPSINGIVTNAIDTALKGVEQSSDTLTAHLGMKMNASLGYTLSKAPEALLNKALEAKSPEDLIDILTSRGVDRNSISEEVIRALTEQSKDKTKAAIELFQSFKQAGVKKGLVKTAMYDLIEEVTGLMERVRAGSGTLSEAINLGSKVFTNFFQQIAGEDLVRPSSAAPFLTDNIPESAGKLVGETYGRAFFATAALKGKVADAVAMSRASAPDTKDIISSTLDDSSLIDDIIGESTIGEEAAETSTQKLRASLSSRAGEFIGTQLGKARNFLSTDGGRLALWGAGLLGAYSIFSAMTSNPDELTPPPLQVNNSSAPLPPPPMLQQPMDYGIQNVPQLNQKIARISPSHPAHPPKPSKIRQYNTYRPGYASANINGRIEDDTTSMNSAVISQRMKNIANSDFVY